MNCEQETDNVKTPKVEFPSILMEEVSPKKICKQIKYKIRLITMHYYYVLLFCICIVY